MRCHIVKNTLLHIAFSAILRGGFSITLAEESKMKLLLFIASQPAHDVWTTLYGRWNDVKTLKWRCNNVVLASCVNCDTQFSSQAYNLVQFGMFFFWQYINFTSEQSKQNLPLSLKYNNSMLLLFFYSWWWFYWMVVIRRMLENMWRGWTNT